RGLLRRHVAALGDQRDLSGARSNVLVGQQAEGRVLTGMMTGDAGGQDDWGEGAGEGRNSGGGRFGRGDQDEIESDDRLNRFHMRRSAYHVTFAPSRMSRPCRMLAGARYAGGLPTETPATAVGWNVVLRTVK